MTEEEVTRPTGGADHLDTRQIIHRSATQLEFLARAIAARALTAPLDTIDQWREAAKRSGGIVRMLEAVRDAVDAISDVPADFAAARGRLAAPVEVQAFPEESQETDSLYSHIVAPNLQPSIEAAEDEPITITIVGAKHLQIGGQTVMLDGDLLYAWNVLAKNNHTPQSLKQLSSQGFRNATFGVTPLLALQTLTALFEEHSIDGLLLVTNPQGEQLYQLSPRLRATHSEADAVANEAAPIYRTAAEGMTLKQMSSLAGLNEDVAIEDIIGARQAEQAFTVPGSADTYIPLEIAHLIIERARASESPDSMRGIPPAHYRVGNVYAAMPRVARMPLSVMRRMLKDTPFKIDRLELDGRGVQVLERKAFDLLLAYNLDDSQARTPRYGTRKTPTMPEKEKTAAQAAHQAEPVVAEQAPEAVEEAALTPLPRQEPEQASFPPAVDPSIMMRGLLQAISNQSRTARVAPADTAQPLAEHSPTPPEVSSAETTTAFDHSEEEVKEPTRVQNLAVQLVSDYNSPTLIATSINSVLRKLRRPRINNGVVIAAAETVQMAAQPGQFPPRNIAPNGTVEYSLREARAIAAEIMRSYGFVQNELD